MTLQRYSLPDQAIAHLERDGEGNEQTLAKFKAAMLKVGELGCVRCQEARERLRSFGDRSRADVTGVEALLEVGRRFRGVEAGNEKRSIQWSHSGRGSNRLVRLPLLRNFRVALVVGVCTACLLGFALVAEKAFWKE